MRINLASVFVDDQEKALCFYTEVLGFVKKHDVPLGEDRWVTVVSPQDPDGVELLLEPSGHPAVKPFTGRWCPTAFPLPRSRWTTSIPSTNGSAGSACGSRASRRPWGR